ncbi:GAF and ANTAR domain-containing protein [Geodermatophilus sp. TF02-6]|uniref:GAF and ANTAR domain-containing protein n=1 Tax=Geodermatophilus sp. TF02-6 TaxID=2250575 RepID=UPI001313FF2A|nr:GAF and ANTAR domain-containing protein [Geodermatophilus sp. TF02-6]
MQTPPDAPAPDVLAGLARLAEDDDPASVLDRLVRHATTLVSGCSGAALTVATPTGGLTATVTDGRVDRCHAVQFRDGGDGPAREALRHREPRRVDHVLRESRWPEFRAVAAAEGFGSCLALPLAAERVPAAALNLYADRPGVFDGTTHDVALLFAAQGGVALDNAELYHRSRELVEHLHRTLATRSSIERAKGVLMARHGIGSDAAFDLLRAESQHSHRKLRDVAVAVLQQQEPGVPEVAWAPVRVHGGPGSGTSVSLAGREHRP